MWLKNDKSIHFKAKLFTVHLSAKIEGHCSDFHGQQEKLQVLMRHQASVRKGGVRIRDQIQGKQKQEGGPCFCLSSITYGSKSNDFFPKGQQEELMEKKREVLIGYENEC